MPYELLDFDNLCTDMRSVNPKHLVLGNGFSISLLQTLDIGAPPFSYTSVIEDIRQGYREGVYQFSGNIESAIDLANTFNLESIIQELGCIAKYSDIYHVQEDVCADIQLLKDVLPKIISRKHPPSHLYAIRYNGDEEEKVDMPDSLFESCANFLQGFHNIFTLNYDLFLYWTINKTSLKKQYGDGFGNDQGRGDLIWRNTYKAPKHKKFHYLHGGLHYYLNNDYEQFTFDRGLPCEKLSYDDFNTRNIKEQVEDKIHNGRIPLVVVEGNSEAKREMIRNIPVLKNALEKLTQISGDVVIFGCDLEDDEDNHLLEAICRKGVEKIWYGFHGENDFENRAHTIFSKVTALSPGGNNIPKVKFFNTEQKNIWQDF